MATIGLDKLYYAEITEDTDGNETYGTPTLLAPAISAELSVDVLEATLYADDGIYQTNKEFGSGTLSLGIAELGNEKAAALLGATIDKNGVLVSASEDAAKPVAIGLRAKNDNGGYRYMWLYRVVFGIPSKSYATKGDSISYTTPTIEGTIARRHKEDARGNHPWHVEANEKNSTVTSATTSAWFEKVYEPSYATT